MGEGIRLEDGELDSSGRDNDQGIDPSPNDVEDDNSSEEDAGQGECVSKDEGGDEVSSESDVEAI